MYDSTVYIIPLLTQFDIIDTQELATRRQYLGKKFGGIGRKFLCINDVKLSEERYNAYRTIIHESFGTRFPAKSRFER